MAVCPWSLGSALEVFERNFRERGELGASVSIWWNGQELLSEGHGWCEKEHQRHWTVDTLVPVYSATKGPASAALLHALESHGLDESTPVREVWPGFPLEEARFSHLLSHQCGLAALDKVADVRDHAAVVAALEAQKPAWRPGREHGYHPRTFGALLEEPVRRLSGMTLGGYWREWIGGPLDLEFWIGLPEAEWPRVARLYPGRSPSGLADGFYEQFNKDGSLTRRAFGSPRGLHAVQEMNQPSAWAAGLPAFGGVGTARALAKFYQAAIGAIPSPMGAGVRRALAGLQSQSYDQVLHRETAFTCGCQRDPVDAEGRKMRRIYGPSLSAFGHPGAGGSHAMGDPETGISFAYVMNQMDLTIMPGVKCMEMIGATFSRF